jgi:hypothetical protein
LFKYFFFILKKHKDISTTITNVDLPPIEDVVASTAPKSVTIAGPTNERGYLKNTKDIRACWNFDFPVTDILQIENSGCFT